MKTPAQILVALLLCICAGAVGGILATAWDPASSGGLTPAHATGEPGSSRTASPSAIRDSVHVEGPADPALRTSLSAELESLTREVAELRAELDELRGSARRTPLDASATTRTDASLGRTEREVILEVLGEERARREQELAQALEKRRVGEFQKRVRRLAGRAGLDSAAEQQLSQVLELEQEKRRGAIEDLRALGGRDSRELIRSALSDIRDWKRTELTHHFGAEAAKKIIALDGARGSDARGGRRTDSLDFIGR